MVTKSHYSVGDNKIRATNIKYDCYDINSLPFSLINLFMIGLRLALAINNFNLINSKNNFLFVKYIFEKK